MDVLAPGLSRSTPIPLPEPDDDPSLWSRIRGLFLEPPGDRHGGTPTHDAASRISTRTILLGFTAAEITIGIVLLVVGTITVPIFPTIASPSLDGTALAGTTGGVLLWTLFGLLGSIRTVDTADGTGHFTFHLPFVGAAMILGGPTAGAWVAFLATTDRRELQSQPWYGVLANHASIAIAAVAGGISYALLASSIEAATHDPGMARFLAILAAGLVLEVVANGLAIVTIKIRDAMSWSGVLGIVVDDFRSETLLEVALIWILVIASSTAGWWAPLVIGIGVVAYLGVARGPRIDRLTGLIKEETFLAKVDRKLGWIRLGMLPGGALFFFDINDFGEVNNRHDYKVGNEVLREVAARMREVFPRMEDILSRLMGDEFGVFLVGLTDPVVAERKARELIASLERPIPTSVGMMQFTIAVGVVVTDTTGIAAPSAATLLDRAVNSVHIAKDAKPVSNHHLWAAGDPKVAYTRAAPLD